MAEGGAKRKFSVLLIDGVETREDGETGGRKMKMRFLSPLTSPMGSVVKEFRSRVDADAYPHLKETLDGKELRLMCPDEDEHDVEESIGTSHTIVPSPPPPPFILTTTVIWM